MGMATNTLEMQNPEYTREKLHGLVKDTRTVIVLSGTAGAAIDGRPMALVRTGDDTTMVLATSLDAAQADDLERNPRVTVVLQGAGYALFTGEARISRDRGVIGELWTDAWRTWCHGKHDPTLAVVTVEPIEGSYWEATDRHSYMYRLVDD
ncbi:MAG: pyridoxamine 5'-phosphate oxidase family protein [Kofleriaceae bacterium]